MNDDCDRFFVVTGGPGAGKTTLLNALARRGFATTVEAGRGVIQDQVAIGGIALPWRDPAFFAELMLAWDMRSHHMARNETGPVFFDRGVAELIGYLELSGLPVPRHFTRAVDLFRYNKRVFIAPPWPEIYAQDEERKQTLDEAERTYRAAASVYRRLGFELIELPRIPVEDRAAFVLNHIGAG